MVNEFLTGKRAVLGAYSLSSCAANGSSDTPISDLRSVVMLQIMLIRMSWLCPGDLRCIRRFRSIPGAAAQWRNPSRDPHRVASHPVGVSVYFCVAGDAAWGWLRRPANRNNRSCRTTSKSPSCKSDSRRSLRPSWQAVAALLGSRRRSSCSSDGHVRGRMHSAELHAIAIDQPTQWSLDDIVYGPHHRLRARLRCPE